MCKDTFIEKYKTNNIKDWNESIELEKIGHNLVTDFNIYKNCALDFINRVETWKAMGIQKRIFGVGHTTDLQAQSAIHNVIIATTEKAKIESLHTLRGFGTSTERPAKVASAAMRFLYPEKWGVVDWRSGCLASSLIKNYFDIDSTIGSLSKINSQDFRDAFENINSSGAIEINKQYRLIGDKFQIKNNADVDRFLFGISLEIWPLGEKFC